MNEFPVQLRTTLSHAAPDKAAQIRSAVTGALQHGRNGMFCFERSVETSFVLPWDLNPRVEPQRLSRQVRDGIRGELMDEQALAHLEQSGSVNWNGTVMWQYRSPQGGPWHGVEELSAAAAGELEAGYAAAGNEYSFTTFTTQFQVNYLSHRLACVSATSTLYEIRRLAFAPLMPMKTEADTCSLFHAASLGFWGVHDRTLLLSQAVMHTLADMKAQYSIYDRWTEEMTRNNPQHGKPEFPQWEAAKQNIVGQPQLHIFTLANVVQRPVIVYSHPESTVGGVYLPLLWEGRGGVFPCDSHPHLKNPLVLGYDSTRSHFMPLVTFKGPKGPDPILLPLMNANGSLLRVHFINEDQAKDPTALLSKLMFVDIIENTAPNEIPSSPSKVLHVTSAFGTSPLAEFGSHPIPLTPSPPPTLTCVLNLLEMPEVMDQLVKRYQSLFL